MGKRFLIGAGYGVIGLVIAVGLTMGAYALAGRDLSQPARPVGAGNALAPKASATVTPSAQSQREARRERVRERKAELRKSRRQDRKSGPGSNGGPGSSSGSSSPSGSGSDDHSGSDDSGSDDHSDD